MKASHKEKYIDAGQKTVVILPTRYLHVYLLITVKTNARVNTRDSKMLPTNRAMRSDCLPINIRVGSDILFTLRNPYS